MKLDHFVVHTSNDEQSLLSLKERIAPLGFPFEPRKGKGTKGFKTANIWIGRQYFEIVRLLRDDGGGWTSHWVKKYNQGKRGLFCLFIAVDNIEHVASRLRSEGVLCSGPEPIEFKLFFGLLKFKTPWRVLYTPSLPESDLEIGFIQYDPDPKDRFRRYMNPNSEQRGVIRISKAVVRVPFVEGTLDLLKKLFPTCTVSSSSAVVALDNGSMTFQDERGDPSVTLMAESTDPMLVGGEFDLENVRVKVVGQSQ